MNTHPIFVYGTLRPGCGNARLWEGRATATDDGEAFVIGYALVSNGHFPYAVPAATAQTIGCLIWPYHDDYDDVLADMDRLEGVPHHYQRVTVPVLSTVPGMPVLTAWIYTPNDTRRMADMPDVATRDGYYDWRADPGLPHLRLKGTAMPDDDYDEMCECEVDWCCPMHRHLPTPEDRLATAWSLDHP